MIKLQLKWCKSSKIECTANGKRHTPHAKQKPRTKQNTTLQLKISAKNWRSKTSISCKYFFKWDPFVNHKTYSVVWLQSKTHPVSARHCPPKETRACPHCRLAARTRHRGPSAGARATRRAPAAASGSCPAPLKADGGTRARAH